MSFGDTTKEKTIFKVAARLERETISAAIGGGERAAKYIGTLEWYISQPSTEAFKKITKVGTLPGYTVVCFP